ncbi:hypothetical protein KCP77_07045 [Salmonella enterica subsp. enterica]|nr:hypothetical protein KCP77_07045 [Salmonella enterica subsp. enterica]
MNSASGNASHVAAWPYLVASHARHGGWRWRRPFLSRHISAGVEIPRALGEEAEIKARSIINHAKASPQLHRRTTGFPYRPAGVNNCAIAIVHRASAITKSFVTTVKFHRNQLLSPAWSYLHPR